MYTLICISFARFSENIDTFSSYISFRIPRFLSVWFGLVCIYKCVYTHTYWWRSFAWIRARAYSSSSTHFLCIALSLSRSLFLPSAILQNTHSFALAFAFAFTCYSSLTSNFLLVFLYPNLIHFFLNFNKLLSDYFVFQFVFFILVALVFVSQRNNERASE